MIFAIIGEEFLLVKRSLDKLLAQRVSETTRDFNFDIFEGGELQAKSVIEAMQTLPMMAERRVILIKNAHELKKSEMEILETFLDKTFPSQSSEGNDLIFVAAKSDSRFLFWQKLLKVAKVREYKPLDVREAPRWILEEAKLSGYTISQEAAEWMSEALGPSLAAIHSSLEKLYLLVGEKKEISLTDVESCITASSWKNIFDLTDAVGQKNLSQALILFQKMNEAGESPIACLALLARHFRILNKVKEGDSASVPYRFLKDYQRQAQSLSFENLVKKRQALFQADWDLKSSPLKSEIIFEKLIMDLCSRG